MATSPKTVIYEKALEDPVAYLPRTSGVEDGKGKLIYDCDQPAHNLYLVIRGKVKVCRVAEDGRPVVIDIYCRDDFFGESALLKLVRRGEQAVTLEPTDLMSWTAAEVEEVTLRRPRLAVALLQLQVQRSMDFGQRIESFSVDHIAQRLARSLLHFADRLGQRDEDGSVQMIPFTHQLLSQFVGTSREIVTHYMNQFRREGYLRYSRKGIAIYADALRSWLQTA